MTVKLQTEHHLEFLSLKGGCTGSYESTHVKIPHCWKSHVTAHMYRRHIVPLGFLRVDRSDKKKLVSTGNTAIEDTKYFPCQRLLAANNLCKQFGARLRGWGQLVPSIFCLHPAPSKNTQNISGILAYPQEIFPFCPLT